MVKNLKKKSFHKYLLCLLTGMLIVGSISVYAVSTIIDSKEVSYDNENSNGSYDNVQLSIDELYQRYKDFTGEQDTLYTEEILNGADPVLGKDMIPITLDGKGNVKYANLYTPWYKYEEKKWANAVILVDNPSQTYKTGDTILEKDIESYFVWIPRYKYKIWDLGNYDNYLEITQLTNNKDDITSIRHMVEKRRLIDIIFENKNTAPSTIQQVGSYYTHPAFIAFDVNGLWIGKFQIGGDIDKIIVKPNVSSLRNQSIGTFWNTLYNYNRALDSHMIKNTEWGAIAYLSHSIYGIGTKININNNESFLTGYSATASTDQSSYPGDSGIDASVTQPYNSTTGYLASTTGNITGIYDMSGIGGEYMAAYLDPYGVSNIYGAKSGLTSDDLTKTQYFDKYSQANNYTYSKRILGDATGEMGPFYNFMDGDGSYRVHNSWYGTYSYFINSDGSWFYRGGHYNSGITSSQFIFDRGIGYGTFTSSRLVLAVK